MKLATLKDGSRDGQLVVVSRDLAQAHYATGIANRLQQVLEDWGFFAPQLQDLSDALNAGRTHHAFPLDPQQCLAPLPRAYQCLQRAESLSEETAARAGMPDMVQLAGDAMLGACADIAAGSTAMEMDFGAGLAVITGDIAAASTPAQALDGVRLVMLANTLSLRALEARERAAGLGPLLSRPATAFSPVAVTLDELGAAWDGGRVALALQVGLNGRKFGLCDGVAGMPWGFGELIAHAARTRPVRAGSIVCSGPLATAAGPLAQGRAESARGFSSMQAKRRAEAQEAGQASTGYLQPGDVLRMEMKGSSGASLFGAIEQAVAEAAPWPQ